MSNAACITVVAPGSAVGADVMTSRISSFFAAISNLSFRFTRRSPRGNDASSGRPQDQTGLTTCLLHVEDFVVELLGKRTRDAYGHSRALADLVSGGDFVNEAESERSRVVIARAAIDAENGVVGDAAVPLAPGE
jgi:hypothetical protein